MAPIPDWPAGDAVGAAVADRDLVVLAGGGIASAAAGSRWLGCLARSPGVAR